MLYIRNLFHGLHVWLPLFGSKKILRFYWLPQQQNINSYSSSKKNNVKTVNLKFELEEGDLMDQKPTLTIFEDLLKVSTLKIIFPSLSTKKNWIEIFWLVCNFFYYFSNQKFKFWSERAIVKITAKNVRVAHFHCQLMTSGKMFFLNQVHRAKFNQKFLR